MTHSYDTKVQFSGTGNPLTQALTLGSGATVLILSIVVGGTTARTGGAPTYNSVAFTQVGTGSYKHASGEMCLEAWYIIAPSRGSSYNISIPNAGGLSLFAHASSFNASLSSVFDTFYQTTGTGANPSIAITTAGTGELLVSMVGDDINSFVPSARSNVDLYETDHGAYGSGHQYELSSSANPDTHSWTVGTADWVAIILAFKDETAIVVPTVTTSACSSVTETGATGNGEITVLGGENATRRGFCFMTGTSGDPTTANSVVYTDGSYGTGTFNQSLGTLSAGTNYRVRAYANNSAGTGYGTTVQLLTHSYPTIAPNTADAYDFGSDDTPTLEFTGSDADSDTLQYEIEIAKTNSFPSAAAVTKQNIETDMGTVHLNNISGSGTEDDRPGNSFLGSGGILDSIHLKLGLQGTISGNLYVKIYEAQGTFGTDAEPLNAAEPASTPTTGYIAISDAWACPGDLTTSGVEKTVTFSGANRIRLLTDHVYYFIVGYVGSGDASNAPFVSVSTAHTYAGDCYNDGQSVSNNGYETDWEVWFKLYEVPYYLDKVSETHSGFVNTVDGGDTQPFTAGQKISYTIQTADKIPETGTYYWHARVKDPSGSNTYSSYTTTRSFTVTVSATNAIVSKDLRSAAPTIDKSILVQNAIASKDTLFGVPTIDKSSLVLTQNVVSKDLYFGIPTVDKPILVLTQAIVSKDALFGVPTIDKPILVQNAIVSKDLLFGVPTIDKSSLVLTQDIISKDTLFGVPTIDKPALVQNAIVSRDIVSGVPTIDKGTLNQVGAVTFPLAFGEQNPSGGEGISWTTFSDGAGGTPDIIGGEWGRVGLNENEEARSAVYDLSSAVARTITFAKNVYGTGTGDHELHIRGAATSFAQDAVSPVWEVYSGEIVRSWRYIQIRVIKSIRLSMWLQPEDIDTKAEIDTLITYASTHGFTDLFASFTDWNTNPKTTLGNSTTGNITAKTADGKYPFTYLVEQATANGIRVHAWVVCNFALHWCGSSAVLLSPLTDNSINHSTTNGGDCLNFSTAAARDAVTDYIADIADSNTGIASLHLDYIRTDGLVTDISLANVTSFVSELRAKTTCPISVCSLGSKYAIASHMQDAVGWIASGYIDMITAMGYETDYLTKFEYLSGYDFVANNKALIWGVGAMLISQRPSDFEANLIRYRERGHRAFSVFSWADDLKDTAAYGTIIDDLFSGNLAVSMGDISKIVVTPATSIALTIGGTEYTTLFSNVTAYTTQGTLKAYIESQEGARPYIYYMRKTTSTIQIMVGEYEA